MQEVVTEAAAGRRSAQQQQQFVGVDLRRPKGYAPPPPQQPQPLAGASQETAEGDPCPRCESRDTKFCYFNNYNTAQPRHFCKGCRRYWTKGGTLRNVPVGGGTRKKPSSSSSSASSTTSSYAAAAKPKRPYKKKRRVAPPSEPTPSSAPVASAGTTQTATATADSAKTTQIATATTEDSAKMTQTATATTEDSAKTTTDAASEITTELVVPAAAAEDDSLTHLLQPEPEDAAVALGLGLSDFPCSAKLLEPDSFEWPASFDLGGTCWGSVGGGGGFGDPSDPALFLNLP